MKPRELMLAMVLGVVVSVWGCLSGAQAQSTETEVRTLDLKRIHDPMIGVKIYEYGGDLAALFAEWRSLGINAAFVSPDLAAGGELRALARRNGVLVFLILPVFFNPEKLKKDPGLYALTDRGEKAKEDWVEFVCPTRADYLGRRVEWIKSLVRDLDPDGISLDFIRFFVFWEMIHPERTPESIPSACFDTSCLEKFQKETGIVLPGGLDGTAAAARWIKARHAPEWTAWKCRVIARAVESIVAAAKAVKPGLIINLHSVPWRRQDFGGAIKAVAGQDLSALGTLVDMVSPMCYWHMLKRQPPWIRQVVEDAYSQTRGAVVPSIQVGNAYIRDPLSLEEFKDALEEALRRPSKGVIFWNWDALAREPEKMAAVEARLKGRD